MGGLREGSTAVVIPFPGAGARPRPRRSDEPRGVILLFTGVRYERLSEPSPAPSTPPARNGQAGRRRRRS